MPSVPFDSIEAAVGHAPVAPVHDTAMALPITGPVQMISPEALAEHGLIEPNGAVTGMSEEFRIVKRELLAQARGTRDAEAIPGGNLILICSAHPGEGKTFCAINLALSMAAEKGVEVVLVDADVAKPSIPATLGISAEAGLMDLLANPAMRVEDVLVRTDVPSLYILPAGQQTKNDTEYLASTGAAQLFKRLAGENPNRIVIMDSPPLLAASPAAVLAAYAGQALMVVRADRTTETALRDAAGLLKGCGHIQLLLNGVKFSASGRRFGTYYGQTKPSQGEPE